MKRSRLSPLRGVLPNVDIIGGVGHSRPARGPGAHKTIQLALKLVGCGKMGFGEETGEGVADSTGRRRIGKRGCWSPRRGCRGAARAGEARPAPPGRRRLRRSAAGSGRPEARSAGSAWIVGAPRGARRSATWARNFAPPPEAGGRRRSPLFDRKAAWSVRDENYASSHVTRSSQVTLVALVALGAASG